MTTVYLDMDGVLVDFLGGVERVFNTKLHPSIPMHTHIGLSLKDFWDRLDGKDFWVNLNWAENGKEILNTCIKTVGKESVYICSAPTLDPQSAAGKLEWLKENIPDIYYSRRYVFTPHKELLANNDSWLIDDNKSNIDKFNSRGGNGLLSTEPISVIEGFLELGNKYYVTMIRSKGQLLGEFPRKQNRRSE